MLDYLAEVKKWRSTDKLENDARDRWKKTIEEMKEYWKIMRLESLNDARVETALIYLSKTDEEHAVLSGEVKRCEGAIKQAKSHAFLLSKWYGSRTRCASYTIVLSYRSAVEEMGR